GGGAHRAVGRRAGGPGLADRGARGRDRASRARAARGVRERRRLDRLAGEGAPRRLGPPREGRARAPPRLPPRQGARPPAAPAPAPGAALACWAAFVSSAMEHVGAAGDATSLARAFLAVAEHPHRASLAATLIDRLREKVALRPSGAITLPDPQARSRAAR